MRNLHKVIAIFLGVLSLGSAVLVSWARAEASRSPAAMSGPVEKGWIHSPVELPPGPAPFVVRQGETVLDEEDTSDVEFDLTTLPFAPQQVWTHHLVTLHQTSLEATPIRRTTITTTLRC